VPRIFDNIELSLLPALRDTLVLSQRADFCVGYFNLRGWRLIDDLISGWRGSEESRARVLIGMQKLPVDELKTIYSLRATETPLDNATAVRLKRKLVEELREQLTYGLPTSQDEAGLRRLAVQLRAGQAVVKLHLAYPLHAKLYLLHRVDPNNPITGFLGSSNLTLAGLSKQGELNVDVLDHDACNKLARWFEDRWNDRWCLDISAELAAIIEQSWAREEPVPPHHIYLKMAWHLSHEARLGLAEYKLPRPFDTILLDFQQAAVKIAAHHVNRRGGVLLGDVVGLGKTLMATALARMLEDDFSWETLILCPKNLVPMWESYREKYGLRGRVMSISQAQKELPKSKRYKLVLIDESHNLRNPEGGRFKAIREYVSQNEAKVILVSATPFNKAYVDLSSQFRLFVPEDKLLPVRPETYLRSLGIAEFRRKHQCEPNTLRAFEHSPYIEDWRELMRLYMVRRTRSFIQQHYAKTEGKRTYLELAGGKRSYFPERVPKTVAFPVDESNADDVYARLYCQDVVRAVAGLRLPRYGLGNFISDKPASSPDKAEQKLLDDLSRAGKRLMGFCRINLFKRLESSGFSFLQATIARAGSRPRNSLIATHLREFPNPPNVDAGEGVPMMFSQMKASGLFPPRYIVNTEAEQASVTVILLNEERPTFWEQVSDWLDRNGAIGNRDLCKITGLDTLKASKLLIRWVEQGLLVPTESTGKRNRRYLKPVPEVPDTLVTLFSNRGDNKPKSQ